MIAMLGRFAAWIDSESVRLYQAVMHGAYLAAGLYMLIVDAVPSLVAAALGPTIDKVWVLLLVLCPLVVIVGHSLHHRAAYEGLVLRLGGNSGLFFALTAYCAAILQAAWRGQAVFSSFLGSGLALCLLLIAVVDARQIIAARDLARQRKQEELER